MKAIRFINQSNANKRIKISPIESDTVKDPDGNFPEWMAAGDDEVGFCLGVVTVFAPVITSVEVIID